jgi:hypothetical protein
MYRCCDELRRNEVATHPPLNGIDYLEVVDRDLSETDPLRQCTLLVSCLRPVPAGLSRDNVRIFGGDRRKNITVEWAMPAATVLAAPDTLQEHGTRGVIDDAADLSLVLVVRVAETGDYSTYTLSLVTSPTDDTPPLNFDRQLSSVQFSFKVDCPSDFDCLPTHLCEAEPAFAPDIDYLAKDYASFRRLMLDRMGLLAPRWQQSHAADYGIALVELLAYAGDQLSYQQDAVATEAYLETARRRVSLRRHALLVDYPMHDGCNARVWLQIEVSAPAVMLALSTTQFLTRCPGFDPGIERGSKVFDKAMLLSPTVFEPLHDATLHMAHNTLSFHTWSDKQCCLPRGATRATLAGHFTDLAVGDVLLFEEVLGPRTGSPADADPAHRHVVRLTEVNAVIDPVGDVPVTNIAWAAEDALPFALCLSSVSDEQHGKVYLAGVSVARGNLILADHGSTIREEPIGRVPAPLLFLAPDCDGDPCAPADAVSVPARFRPTVAHGPLTQAATFQPPAMPGQAAPKRMAFDPAVPAARATDWSMTDVLPQIRLSSLLNTKFHTWEPRRTLLNSGPASSDMVVEVDDDGQAHLRFGDDTNGMRPAVGTEFMATYRIGNGPAGNVGAEAIVHCVASLADLGGIVGIRNPLAAGGGVEPESAESVRRNAPEAFRTQERAVTPADYAEVTERHSGVQQAAATLRWTGSWHTVFITVDPEADADSDALRRDLVPFVDRYRMAGHDLEFDNPIYVSLEIDMHVCAKPDYFRSDVERSLLDLFSNREFANGRRGLFHPDNFSFGDTVYLSRLYAAAQETPGVASVRIDTFQRQGTDSQIYLQDGKLPLGRLEIARLDNDANYPERGVLRLEINGGK